MSDVNLNFVVENNNIGFTVEPNDITITPEQIQLSFNTTSQLNAGGSNTQLQYNNGSLLAGIPTATYNGSNLSLGSVANLKITGGTNGYVLQTDGTGNLDWAAAGGGGGNGTPGGSNTQIQYNDAGSFGGNTGFTFNEITGNVNIPGSLAVVGNITGNFVVTNANYANYAGNAFSVSGSNVVGAVANATYADNAGNATIANSANSVAGANVTGQVSNSLIAGTVYTNNQPNITSVGTLINLTVSGNITSSNANLGNLVIANFFQGSGNLLSNIQASNISGLIANANYAAYAGNVTIASQSNITSLGNLVDLRVNNTKIHLGTSAGSTGQGNFAIAIGANAGLANAGVGSIAIGANAGGTGTLGTYSVAIGYQAAQGGFGNNVVSIGYGTGLSAQQSYTVAIGSLAGSAGQKIGAVAVGYSAGGSNQSNRAIAVGFTAGGQQNESAIAIGPYTAPYLQGNYSIAIGANAAGDSSSPQHDNSIILSAIGANLSSTQANSLFVKPIRDVTGNVDFTVQLYYNPTTGEIGYK